MKLELVSGIPYTENDLLTPAEVDSISHYKDCGNEQHTWDSKLKICKKKSNKHIDCEMINGILRENIDKKKLSYSDRCFFDYTSKDVNYAIVKNKSPYTFKVIKGLGSTNFLKGKGIGDILEDKGFGGYTTNVSVAKTYVGTNPPYFLLQKIHKGDTVLYIDDEENEWLFPPYSKYVIVDIMEDENLYTDRVATVYYIKRLK